MPVAQDAARNARITTDTDSIMNSTRRRVTTLAALLAVAGLGACTGFQNMVQPPAFDIAEGRASELRIVGPSAARPLGGAQVRIWTRVQNPNAVGFTLSRLTGHLLLEGDHAAAIDLPIGLPLPAAGDTIIPLDMTLSFADVPGLANQLLAAVTGQRLNYSVEGVIGVDAGILGQPTFGPSTWLRGDFSVIR
jgi:hypothetical protein